MLNKIFKLIIGLALIPVAVSAVFCLYEQIANIRIARTGETFFVWGALAYVLLDLLLARPKAVYVFSHEATHAIFTWIFGGKVKDFKASAKGGSVKTTKTNILISLSPYFVPFYTLICSLFYFLFSLFLPQIKYYADWFLFIVGFTLVFHLVLTVDTLKTKQPDLADNGYLFSLSLIVLMNVIILVLVLAGLFDHVNIKEFFITTILRAKEWYINGFNYVFMFR